ncbi:MAG: phage major capsid protein, partial [Alphaproteobacteria bacterium]
WYCSQSFWAGVFQRIALAAGGNAVANLVSGVQSTTFMGIPVEITQTLPLDGAPSTLPLYLGDMRETVLFGDRRQSTISMSEHSSFENDEIEWKGTERFDINCYNVGNADAVAKNRKPGGMIGLYLPA